MRFLDLVLYASLFVFVLYVTRVNNMWGVSKGTKKAKEDVRLEKLNLKKRRRIVWLLEKCEWIARNIGFALTDQKEADYKYKIDRLRWYIKILNRNIKPIELVGLFKLLQLVGSFILIIGVVLTGSPLFLIFLTLVFSPAIFHTYATAKISDEDAKIERYFPDLFLILYSRLLQGSRARLSPVLKDYLIALDAVGVDKEKEPIKNFVIDLRNNIEIYGDDSIAVMKLREKYHSVMIINFCNLAVQALNGVDNSDKLLSFKIELNNKRVEQLQERAEKIVRKGSRAVLVVYLILFQFVLLSWIAKLTQADGVSSIFGL